MAMTQDYKETDTASHGQDDSSGLESDRMDFVKIQEESGFARQVLARESEDVWNDL